VTRRRPKADPMTEAARAETVAVNSRIRGNVFRFATSPNFRGDRGQRDLPIGLTRGSGSGGFLPWMPIFDEAELEVLTAAAS
jgi:hypothetical protein